MGRKEYGKESGGKEMKNLTLNKKLAFIAIGLGFIGLFLGNPYKGNLVSMNTKELGMIVEGKVDHVSLNGF